MYIDGGYGTAGQVLVSGGGAATCTWGNGFRMIWGEVPSGTINSSNDEFTLANEPTSSSTLMIFKNGICQKLTDDYTINVATITFVAGNIPQTGDNLIVTYQY